MRKFFVVISIFLAFILIYLLQSNLFNWLTIARVKPNLFVILILFVGLYAGRRIGISVGVVIGIILDLFISKNIGASGIILGLIGFFGGYFNKHFSKDSKITIILMVIGATMFFEIVMYAISIIAFDGLLEIAAFFKILSIEVIYNVLLTIIIYPLLQITGYYIEDTFKGFNVLTKYF